MVALIQLNKRLKAAIQQTLDAIVDETVCVLF